MVIYREWERHKNSGHTHSRNFADGASPCATNQHIGLRHFTGHIINKGQQLRLHTGSGIVLAQLRNLLFATLVQHRGARIFRH